MATLAQRLEERKREMRARGLATAPSPADDLGRALDEDLSIMRRRDRLVAAGLVERGATFTPSEPPCSPAPMVGCDEADRHHPGAGGATAPRAPIPAGPAESGLSPAEPIGLRAPLQPPEPAGASRERTPATAPEAPLPKETPMSRKARPLPPREEWLLARLVPPPTLRGRRAIGGACSATRALFKVPFEWVDKPMQDGRISALVVRVPWFDRLQKNATHRGWQVEALTAWLPVPANPRGTGKAPEPPEASAPAPMLTDAPVPDAPPVPGEPAEVPPCPTVEDLAARVPDVVARALALADEVTEIESIVCEVYEEFPNGPDLVERIRMLVSDRRADSAELAAIALALLEAGHLATEEPLATRVRRALAGADAPRMVRIPVRLDIVIGPIPGAAVVVPHA